MLADVEQGEQGTELAAHPSFLLTRHVDQKPLNGSEKRDGLVCERWSLRCRSFMMLNNVCFHTFSSAIAERVQIALQAANARLYS